MNTDPQEGTGMNSYGMRVILKTLLRYTLLFSDNSSLRNNDIGMSFLIFGAYGYYTFTRTQDLQALNPVL